MESTNAVDPEPILQEEFLGPESWQMKKPSLLLGLIMLMEIHGSLPLYKPLIWVILNFIYKK